MRIARTGAYAASISLVLAGLGLATPPAGAATNPVGVDDGAAWLASQVSNGVVHNNQYAFDDFALSGDVAFALDTVDRSPATVTAIMTALGQGGGAQWYSYDDGTTRSIYAGSLAKLLTLVQQTGEGSPTAFGGENLVDLLEQRVATSSPLTGRIEDANNAFGDSNVVGQAFAARALRTAGSGRAADAESFLLQQQCSNGGFRQDFSAKAASDQSCTDPTKASVDTTAIALIQLQSETSPSGAVTTAISAARTFLTGTQDVQTGAWGGGNGTSAANANSTGLAAWALGDVAASTKAAGWLRDHQLSSADACGPLASQRGAIAYDDADLAAGRTDGITVEKQDAWRRSSAQAVPGLAYLESVDAGTAPSISAPSGYLRAGSSYPVRISGLADGADACLSGVGTADHLTSSGTTITRNVRMPAGTATRTYTVRDAEARTASAAVHVLGIKTLSVARSRYRVHQGRFVTITVRGLAAGERTVVSYKGRVVRTTYATRDGVSWARFRVGRATGVKRILAVGQFADIRRGSTTIRVVR